MLDSARIHYALFIAMAMALNIPLVFGEVQGIDLCVSLLLAPLVGWYAWQSVGERSMRAEVLLFLLASLGGLASCFVWYWRAPDGEILRHLGSLIMILYCIGFVFAGWQASKHVSAQQRLTALAVSASAFLIVVAAPHLVWSSPVRITPNEQAQLAITFMGLKVFGTFGVLSTAYLWCMQTAVCLAGMLSLRARALRVVSAAGFVSGIFLVAASESRGAQMCVLLLIASLFISMLRYRRWRFILVWAIGFAVLLVACLTQIPQNGTRFGRSIMAIESLIFDDTGASVEHNRFSMLVILTGRDQLIRSAYEDIRANPMFGTGFSGKMYLNEPTYARPSMNSSTHIYYITLLWKGGLLFALPIFTFIAVQMIRLWRRRDEWRANGQVFVVLAIALAFAFLALLWDILMVPSAGALSYFLLGLFTAPRHA